MSNTPGSEEARVMEGHRNTITLLITGLVSACLFGAATPASKAFLTGIQPQVLAGLLYLGAAFGVLPCVTNRTVCVLICQKQIIFGFLYRQTFFHEPIANNHVTIVRQAECAKIKGFSPTTACRRTRIARRRRGASAVAQIKHQTRRILS